MVSFLWNVKKTTVKTRTLGIAYNVISALGGMKPVFQERNVAFVANRKPTTVVSNVRLERPVAIVKPDLIRG